jgi:hypothetical protein
MSNFSKKSDAVWTFDSAICTHNVIYTRRCFRVDEHVFRKPYFASHNSIILQWYDRLNYWATAIPVWCGILISFAESLLQMIISWNCSRRAKCGSSFRKEGCQYFGLGVCTWLWMSSPCLHEGVKGALDYNSRSEEIGLLRIRSM